MKKILFTSALLLSGASILNAQKAPINWYLQSFAKDGVFGTGATQAYEYLNGMTPQTVIVAVIDSGVEVDHEDLKGVIWTNKNEIPDNGIDDDKNGYVDDVHGWSFLGGPGGDINHEAMEIARLYHHARRSCEGQDTSKLSGKQLEEYKEYLDLKVDFQKEQKEIEECFLITKFSIQGQHYDELNGNARKSGAVKQCRIPPQFPIAVFEVVVKDK